MEPEYNQRYTDWKDWSAGAFGQASRSEHAYFEAELRRAGLWPVKGLRLLEIGFGNGAFLHHARQLGAEVSGTEANDGLARRARDAGFDAHTAMGLEAFADASLDGVLLFDVLEHIPQDSLESVLKDIRRVLKPGGKVVARFPNGDSPLSLASQNGDVTHVTYLGSEKVRYLLAQAGLKPVFLAGPAPLLWDPDLKRRALKLAQWLPRKLVEKTIKLLFFPTTQIQYFSSNLVACATVPNGLEQLP